MKLVFNILLLCVFINTSLFCNDSTITDSVKAKPLINKQYFKSYYLDLKDYFIAPTRWKGKDWAITGGVIAGTGLLYTQDKEIQLWLSERTTKSSEDISKYALEPWGSGLYSMSTMGLFYLHGTVFKNRRSKKVALLGVKSFLISGFLVNIPKHLFNRHRPYNDDPPNPYIWEGPFADRYYKSFVSGHTTSIFAVAAIVSSEYKDKFYVPLISYSIAGFSAFSRMHDNKHWASDVFAGAFFGWAIGKMIYNLDNWKVNLGPSTDLPGGLSLKINLNKKQETLPVSSALNMQY